MATKSKRAEPSAAYPLLSFETQERWTEWLHANHASSAGVWLRFVRKGKSNGAAALTYSQAVETALCYGWIDGQVKGEGDTTWLQRYTPRGAKSIWSKINRAKALALIESGRMQPAGLREVQRAQADGRWDAAYDSPRTAEVPPAFAAALRANAKAAAFFEELDSRNRYAILFRLQTLKTEAARARRVAQYVDMLANGQTLYPQPKAKAAAPTASPS